ncbi:MAG TPA: hypothetical protein VLF67_00225 [Candidatus Saccharimonas sp.]|nr:hypothetical protein [Candidatus Saccharimonas sp.]
MSRLERELAAEAVERELHLPVGHHPDLESVEQTKDQEETAEQPESPAEAEPEQIAPEKRRGGWGRMVVTSTMIGIGLGAGIAALYHFTDQPAQGKVTFAQAEASVMPTPTPLPTNSLGGLYVTMQYPGKFDQLSQLKPGPRDLETYMLSTRSAPTAPRVSMAVAVMTLPTGKLDDDPSYLMRKLRNTAYTPTPQTVGGEPAVLMASTDGQEQTLFWAHGQRELTVSITSNGDAGTIDEAMKLALASARWRP